MMRVRPSLGRGLISRTDSAGVDLVVDLVNEYLAAGAIRVVTEFGERDGGQARAWARRAAKAWFG
ncbi:MAG: hypothetical protein QOH17_654 [Pseudonocardiales bacterium]|nr:hypothetical protein [Pseudonocardiales bacterium]